MKVWLQQNLFSVVKQNNLISHGHALSKVLEFLILTWAIFYNWKIILFGTAAANFLNSYPYYLNQIVKAITKNKGNGYEDLQT